MTAEVGSKSFSLNLNPEMFEKLRENIKEQNQTPGEAYQQFLNEVKQAGRKYYATQSEITGVPSNSRCCISTSLTAIQGIALFIFSCMAVFNAVSGVTIGGVAIGLGTGMILTDLCRGDVLKNKKYHILTALTCLSFIALGALGLGGVMSASKVGLSLLGVRVLLVAASCGVGCTEENCTKGGRERKQKLNQSSQEYFKELRSALQRLERSVA